MQTGTKVGIGIVVVLVIVGLGYWFFGGSQSPKPFAYTVPAMPQAPTPTPVTPTPPATPPSTNPTPTPAASNIIEYTDQGFSPGTITIRKGETVTWVNHSSDAMWVASNPHPVHSGYPEKGGCISSVFDACVGFEPGKSYSFTFNDIGKWGYHNHSNPADHGVVIVQ